MPSRGRGRSRRGGPPPGRPNKGGRPHGRGGRGNARTGPVGGAKSSGKDLGGRQVEGRQAVRELLLAQRRRVHEIWISSDLEGSDSVDDIVTLAAAERVAVSYVARKRLESEARSEAPQGVLAKAAPIPEAALHDFLGTRPNGAGSFLVAVDGVTDPGNLGAIIRSCDGSGVDAVVLPRHRAVHVTPTVAKASAGAVEYLPMALVSGLPSALQEMRDAGIWIIGCDDAADRSLFELEQNYSTDGVCIVMGAEGAGLSRLVRERCDLIVSIPMRGHVGSLNVSAATALATYEISRQRPHA